MQEEHHMTVKKRGNTYYNLFLLLCFVSSVVFRFFYCVLFFLLCLVFLLCFLFSFVFNFFCYIKFLLLCLVPCIANYDSNNENRAPWIMSINSSINKVSNIRVLFILFSLYLIETIECWPVFKQDPWIVVISFIKLKILLKYNIPCTFQTPVHFQILVAIARK